MLKSRPKTKQTSKTRKQSKKQPTKRWSAWRVLRYVAVLTVAILGWLIWQALYTPLPMNKKQHVLTVPQGATYFGLINQWEKDGDISLSPLAKAYTRLLIKKPLMSGAYAIPKDANLSRTLDLLSGGKQTELLRIQIIEGKRTADLFDIIRNTQNVRLNVINAGSPDDIIRALDLPITHLEGWFAPDTYFFSQGSTDEEILKHLYRQQKKTLDKAWATRDKNLPYKTPYDALIMASIIEKETSIADERGKVAAVFVNRLRKGMKLQTDPTVIYGMGERYDGDIRRKDLREKTPYNTYVISGLPPTPIALPSAASIKAAMHPDDTDVLFFVATGHGGHTFTRTYAEHKKAVQAYLRTMRQKKQTS